MLSRCKEVPLLFVSFSFSLFRALVRLRLRDQNQANSNATKPSASVEYSFTRAERESTRDTAFLKIKSILDVPSVLPRKFFILERVFTFFFVFHLLSLSDYQTQTQRLRQRPRPRTSAARLRPRPRPGAELLGGWPRLDRLHDEDPHRSAFLFLKNKIGFLPTCD